MIARAVAAASAVARTSSAQAQAQARTLVGYAARENLPPLVFAFARAKVSRSTLAPVRVRGERRRHRRVAEMNRE